MKRTLGTTLTLPSVLLAALLLVGCGDDGESAGGDRTATDRQTKETTDPGPSGAVDFTEVGLPHATAAGGEVDTTAVPLDTAGAVQDFTAGFEGGSLAGDVQDQVATTDVPDGQVLAGAVVSIGCDVPPGVTVQRAGSGLQVMPLKVKAPTPECFAPVTTVALVLVDADEV